MKSYVKPEVKVIKLESTDVLQSSTSSDTSFATSFDYDDID